MSFLANLLKKKSQTYHTYFEVFKDVYTLSTHFTYWIKPFPEKIDRFIMSQFCHQKYLPYNGLEIVIMDNDQVTYHRLPGAKPNGKGFVETGTHYIKLNSMNDTETHYLCINKPLHPDIQITSISSLTSQNRDYQYLPKRILYNELFIPELIENIIIMLNWNYYCLSSKSMKAPENLDKILYSILQKKIDCRILSLVYRIKQQYDLIKNA